MAEASLLHVAESLLGKLTPYAFKEIKSWWGAKDDLQGLVLSIQIIKAGLLDAEKRQEGRDSEGQLVKEWLRRLRNVLYDADDLFDEVITVEESKKTLTGREKFSRELSHFFSKSNPALFLVDIAGRIKKIRKELDGIKSDMDRFRFDYDLSEKVVRIERETGSVNAPDDVIGREKEEKELIRFLLDDKSKEEGMPDVIAIVGFGGLGKTTLAQLLYSNAVVNEKFELCSWACISDIKGKTSKARIILDALQTTEKVGSSEWSFGARNVHEISVNELELKIHGRLQNKKYFLVLDDFWDEDPQTWLYLKGLLKGGKMGSKILLTTRSSKAAVAMGVETPLYLKGLADDKAWELFKRLAFRSAADAKNQSLIMMGKEIVKKCNNVPLAIKAVASLVYTFGDNVSEWESIMDSDMLTLERKHPNLKILPVLKLSYDHLPSHLKHCFALCSLFPKDFKMSGMSLVKYWIALGYVEECCSNREQSRILEAGKSYFKELRARSFLQYDPWEAAYYMHDLMHDLAQAVAGEEVFAANKSNCKIKERNQIYKEVRIRHLSFCQVQNGDDILTWTTAKFLRSFVHAHHPSSRHIADCTILEALLKKLVLRFSLLRLLDLSSMGLERLPSTVGELKHLRCLIISHNRFRLLPDTTTKLHNLKILDVSWCLRLKALPANFERLKNLTCLMVHGCKNLSSMPCRIEDLPSLESLDRFAVRNSLSELEASARSVNQFSSLSVKYLNGSGGRIRKGEEEDKGVDLSSSLSHLYSMEFLWPIPVNAWESSSEFECSQLPSNLKDLHVWYFPGQRLPEWKKNFSCLLIVSIHRSKQCRYLPSFGQHPQLRELHLSCLDELEYIQMEIEEDGDRFAAKTHFPRLEYLCLFELHKLKAWSPGMEELGLQHISSSAAAPFPRFLSLTYLEIARCPELMSLPLPPKGNAVEIFSDVLKEPLCTLLGSNQ